MDLYLEWALKDGVRRGDDPSIRPGTGLVLLTICPSHCSGLGKELVVLDTMLIFWLLDELVVNDRIVLFMTDGDVGMIELVWIIELLLSVVFLKLWLLP